MAPRRNNVLPIAMMFALFFLIAFVTGLPSPIGVIIARQFDATNFQSQLGFFANFIAYAFMGIPSGMLLRRIGYKRTALAAIAVGFAGVGVQFLSARAGSFGIYLTGAFISGFSLCMLNTVVNPMLNLLGGGGRRGNQLIQFGGVFNSIGGTLAPMLVGYLMGAAAGRTLEKANPVFLLAMGIFLAAFVVLWFVRIPEPDCEEPIRMPRAKGVRGPFGFRHFVLGIVAIFLYVGIEVGIPSTANLYMTSYTGSQSEELLAEYERQQSDPAYLAALLAEDASNETAADYESRVVTPEMASKARRIAEGRESPGLGLPAAVAGTIVGLYWLLMLVGRLIGGAAGGRMSPRTMLVGVSAAALLLVVGAIFSPADFSVALPARLGGTHVPFGILLLVLCGLCTSVMWGGIFNLAVAGLGEFTSLASGIFMVMVCGGGILPPLQGYIADAAGYTASYWVVFGGLLYILYYALAGSRPAGCDEEAAR